jgi:hypothetical protein
MFFCSIAMDKGEIIHFQVEAASAASAVRVLGAYLKGRFEGSGVGGEILSVNKARTRGVEYRGL